MQFINVTGELAKLNSKCLVIGVFEAQQLGPIATMFEQISGGLIAQYFAQGDFEGELEQTL